MLSIKEINLIKKIIADVDYTRVENIKIISNDEGIHMSIDGIEEDVYTNKNDFLNMIIDSLSIGATKRDIEYIKQIEAIKENI
ncbi:MAG: hypothetical protein IJ086_03710 [Clostridium sp.]|nr:hypothetical protein [Clostridium sp.]